MARRRFHPEPWALLLTMLALGACDEIPSAPVEGHRVRVALVTVREPADEGTRWRVYEIDGEGTAETVVESPSPIVAARYTSYLSDRRGVGYLTEDGILHIRDLQSGSESTLSGPFDGFRFAPGGNLLTFTRTVAAPSGGEAEQVFVLNRADDSVIQVTYNECETNNPPEPCAWSAARSVFGESSELYMIRRLRTASGDARTALSVVTSSFVEQRYFVVDPDTMEIHPTSFFEGALLGTYLGSERGFFAMNVRSGAMVSNPSELEHFSYCYDSSIAGVDGDVLRFLTIAGDEVGRLTLPHPAGSEILSVDCSRRPKFIPR